jgi:hypothetical protein
MSVSSVSSYSSVNTHYNRDDDNISERSIDIRDNKSQTSFGSRRREKEYRGDHEECEKREICEIPPRHERICEVPCPPRLCTKEIKLKLCCGRKFYLQRKPANPIFIAPGVVVEDYTLHLCFDLKDDSLLVLKKGCKVKGKWYNVNRKIFFLTELIKIGHREYPFIGSSEILNRNDFFNGCEVGFAPYFHQISNDRSSSLNDNRRSINTFCKSKTLLDGRLDTIYQFYPTNQIKCTLDEDFFLTILTEEYE